METAIAGDLRVRGVRGPNGETITLSDLPAGNPKRWLPEMKARVIAAIEGGLISMEEAWRRYRLSPREFECWKSVPQSPSRSWPILRVRREA